jgi:hypothetical protein
VDAILAVCDVMTTDTRAKLPELAEVGQLIRRIRREVAGAAV